MKFEYRWSSINNDDNIEYNNYELKTDANVRTMLNIFFCFETKVLIELDVTISKTVEDIVKMLKRPPKY